MILLRMCFSPILSTGARSLPAIYIIFGENGAGERMEMMYQYHGACASQCALCIYRTGVALHEWD